MFRRDLQTRGSLKHLRPFEWFAFPGPSWQHAQQMAENPQRTQSRPESLFVYAPLELRKIPFACLFQWRAFGPDVCVVSCAFSAQHEREMDWENIRKEILDRSLSVCVKRSQHSQPYVEETRLAFQRIFYKSTQTFFRHEQCPNVAEVGQDEETKARRHCGGKLAPGKKRSVLFARKIGKEEHTLCEQTPCAHEGPRHWRECGHRAGTQPHR